MPDRPDEEELVEFVQIDGLDRFYISKKDLEAIEAAEEQQRVKMEEARERDAEESWFAAKYAADREEMERERHERELAERLEDDERDPA